MCIVRKVRSKGGKKSKGETEEEAVRHKSMVSGMVSDMVSLQSFSTFPDFSLSSMVVWVKHFEGAFTGDGT